MVVVKICWIQEENGGPKNLPTRPRYTAPARFEEDNRWPTESWSLVVNFKEEASDPDCWIADVHFLVEDAPVHLLHPGSRFELYAGRHTIANGEVISDQREAEKSLSA